MIYNKRKLNFSGIGVLAQDVQKVLPEIVDEIEGGKYLGVDYPALIPLLIEAIRELDDRTSLLKLNLETLEVLLKDIIISH